jgi:hypothetical protein
MDLISLTGLVDRLGVLAYRDYCDEELVEWSGWHERGSTTELETFVGGLRASGGGDFPEASRTAFNRVLEYVDRPTVCIIFSDAPPHSEFFSVFDTENIRKERAALGSDFDWVHICKRLAAKHVRVFPFLSTSTSEVSSFFNLVAKVTGGNSMFVANAVASAMSRHIIAMFLALAGHSYEFTGVCGLCTPGVGELESETTCGSFLPLRVADVTLTYPMLSKSITRMCGEPEKLVHRFDTDAG